MSVAKASRLLEPDSHKRREESTESSSENSLDSPEINAGELLEKADADSAVYNKISSKEYEIDQDEGKIIFEDIELEEIESYLDNDDGFWKTLLYPDDPVTATWWGGIGGYTAGSLAGIGSLALGGALTTWAAFGAGLAKEGKGYWNRRKFKKKYSDFDAVFK